MYLVQANDVSCGATMARIVYVIEQTTFRHASKLCDPSGAFLEFFNLPVEEALGKRWTDLVAAAGAELQSHVKAVIKRHERMHAEIELTNQGVLAPSRCRLLVVTARSPRLGQTFGLRLAGLRPLTGRTRLRRE